MSFEKAGKIAVLVGGHRLARPFLDISGMVNSGGEEQGLLSMAFAPDYVTSGRFYVDYTSANGDIHVVGFRRSAGDPDRAGAGTARPVITIAATGDVPDRTSESSAACRIGSR